jgi:ribosomal protein L29
MTTTNKGRDDAHDLQELKKPIGLSSRTKVPHRSTSELVDQLQDQIKAERAQAAARRAEKQCELSAALREIAKLNYRIAKRDREEAFAKAPSPSLMMH